MKDLTHLPEHRIPEKTCLFQAAACKLRAPSNTKCRPIWLSLGNQQRIMDTSRAEESPPPPLISKMPSQLGPAKSCGFSGSSVLSQQGRLDHTREIYCLPDTGTS
ncbi:hypothetical protein JZ751_014671, partial [Albula glossodonta]